MMYRYYRYTMDRDFLRDTAYPFMTGAMRVYEGMLERKGEQYSLPVSVSPEYHTRTTHSPWGRNASFQLACIHRLIEDLLDAAAELGETPDASWREISEKLPKACLIGEEGSERIAIWEGVPLEESHRHHSHLAGITPFDIFDAGRSRLALAHRAQPRRVDLSRPGPVVGLVRAMGGDDSYPLRQGGSGGTAAGKLAARLHQ